MRLLFALFLFLSLFSAIYFIEHIRTLKKNVYNQGCVFVCGDSGMFQGLDVSLLKSKIKKQVLTSAHHGSGVYDFLVNQKSVPSNSVSIISFSESAFLRNPLSDYNRTGLELSCLKLMCRAGCPLDECWEIINKNRKNICYKTFFEEHSLFSYADTLVYPEPLPVWQKMFEEERDWFSWKSKSYMRGIQLLLEKRSQIVLVQFPFNKQVESLAHNSINRRLTDSLKEVVIKDFGLNYEKVVLTSDSLLMHDLSHMNEVGARLTTFEIASILRADTVNNYFVEVVIK